MDNKVPFRLPLEIVQYNRHDKEIVDADGSHVVLVSNTQRGMRIGMALVQAANMHGEFMAALKPFAALADECDRLGHEENSTCEWRIKASDLRKARAVLGKV